MHIVRGDGNSMCLIWSNRDTVFLHLLVALTMHIYILPGMIANEGQFIGSRADHFPILCMKLLAKLQPLTSHEMEDRIKLCSGS